MKTKAAILFELNKPLRIEEIEIPKLESGQVLVKMVYSGVCHSQLMEVQGKRGHDLYLPHLLGHEGSGEVVDVGSSVIKAKVGDKVVLTWIKGKGANCVGAKYRFGSQIINSGCVTTFSEYTVVSENRCIKIPDDFPLDAASILGCAVLTGAGMVLNTIKPKPENSIAIWGAGGGVGLSAVMGAKICNCSKIIAVDIDEKKLSLAKELGATHVVNTRGCDSLSTIRDITGGVGLDYSVDSAGRTQTIESAFKAIRSDGGLCVFASHPSAGEKIQIDPYDLICGKQIKGSWGGESYPDRDIPIFVDFYRQGKLPLKKMMTHEYRLEQINEALKGLDVGCVGRILINMIMS
jgi:S-(hydroxymethyl)glutathione dehydrogenase/alcohol dehydrogenase